MSDFEVAVVGAGYVGLTTAVCLAHLGNRVVAVDVDEAKVAAMSAGQCPILEVGLEEMQKAAVAAGRLSFTTDAEKAVSGADFVFLCLPTPQGADGAADLRFVRQAALRIASHLKPGAVVVNKSTVPVGSAGMVAAALGRPDTTVVSNPEFLREGTAVQDWLHPDRVVIGCEDRAAGEALAVLYEPLNAPIVITDPASAETIKYACNAFLAAKVSFVNAIANLCSAVGADVMDVIEGMSYDRRIGADHLSPGPGWGGSCFPKDTAALLRIAEDHGYDFALLRGVITANEAQFDTVARQVADAAGGDLAGGVIALWGLTFKAGTDDLRDSPALEVARRLSAAGAHLRGYDPSGPDPASPYLSSLDIEVLADPIEACSGARALVVLTEWPEFRTVDLGAVASALDGATVVDTRNLLDPAAASSAGLSYTGMGRSARPAAATAVPPA